MFLRATFVAAAIVAAATLVLARCGTPGQRAAPTVTVTSTLQPVIQTVGPQFYDRRDH
jgi:hypothetical protein